LRTISSYGWIALCVLLRSGASACAKQAGVVSAGKAPLAMVANPWYAAEIGFLVVQALCWVMALRRFPLSFAYPFMSLVIGVNLAWAWLFFGEPVRVGHGAAILVIILGVALVAREERI
jgi:drug/metabolite transporter (DMT)-like permease